MSTLIQDLRFGLRMLFKQPGFTLIAVLTLALGIGANTAIFSVVDAVLLRPVPYPESEGLVFLWSTMQARGVAQSGSSMPDYREWREQSRSFDGLAGFYYGDFNLAAEGGEPERVQGAYVTSNLFDVLQVAPRLGRSFAPEEDQFGRHRVALLGYGLWQRRFGGDPSIVGRAIRLGGESYTVTGVMPEGMPFFDNMPAVELWTPIAFASGNSLDTRNNYFVNLVGRLKTGVNIAAAQAETSAIARRIEEQFPGNDLGAQLVPLQQQLVDDSRRALFILLGAVAFVLLAACVNVASLLLVRAAAREKELAVRAALGAGPARIVRQMLLECLPLAGLGGALGALLAWWGIDLLATLLPPSLPRYNAIGVSGRVLAFTSALSLLTVFLFGLLPARQAARADVREALNEGGRGGVGSRRQGRLQRWLVVTEIALALVLLVGAGLLARSFSKLRQVDTGVSARNVLTMRVALPEAKYPIPISASDPRAPAALPFLERLLERLTALPGVTAVSAGTLLPLGAGQGWGKHLSIEGRPAPALEQTPLVRFSLISPDYFRTLGIAVERGRAFTATDREQTQPVAVINETLRRHFFPNEDPIGKTIWLGVPEHLLPPAQQTPENRLPRRLIVGVVADVKGGSLNQPPLPLVYAPLTQYRREGWNNTLMLAVQTASAPESVSAAVCAGVQALDPDQPVTNVRTMDELLQQTLAAARFSLLLLGLFAGVALVLAGLGIYGVLAHTVAQQQREIGIRMALGAQAGDVLRMVARQGLTLALIGIAIGLAASLTLTRLMATLLYEVTATDPLTFAGVAALLLSVALLACYVPSRQAMKTDPLTALRSE